MSEIFDDSIPVDDPNFLLGLKENPPPTARMSITLPIEVRDWLASGSQSASRVACEILIEAYAKAHAVPAPQLPSWGGRREDDTKGMEFAK